MIELLNKYRAAKNASEEAARDMGRAFGEAFEQEIRGIEEFQLPQFDDLTGPARIATLNNAFPIGIAVQQALGGFIKQEHDMFVVGVNLHNPVLSRIQGSRIVLDEAPFMEGFMEGYRKSRKSFQRERNGTPAVATSR